MKSFKQFVFEARSHSPVVTIDRSYPNVSSLEGLSELNKNLSIVLSAGFSHVGDGLSKARKVMSMYGLELPTLDIPRKDKGEIVAPISPYESSGESVRDVTGPFQEKGRDFEFKYKYELKDGVYNVSAEVVDV